MKLKNQIAIVTGGGGAIGGAIARQLASEGAEVVLFDIRAEFAAKNAAPIIKAGGVAESVGLDITNADEVSTAVEDVVSRHGRIDILVNCAGGSARGKMKLFHEQSLDVVREVLAVNLYGALYCIHAVARHMVAARSGRVVNIGSAVAVQGLGRCVDYSASKGGIISATRSLAKELGPFGITVNCVSPGLVQRTAVADEAEFARHNSYVNRICMQDDVARAVLFFALPESDIITGQDLAVDGGRSLGLRGDR